MKIHTEDLLAFLAVAEAGSVGGATQTLNRSQPAVSERLRSLQVTIGETLYLRAGRGIRLTAAGESLVPLIRRLQEDLQQVEAWAGRHRNLQEGQIRIMASSTVANYFLMEHLAQFRRSYPGVHLQIRTGSLDLSAIAWHSWDLVFTEEAIPATRLPPYMRQTAWREDEIVAIFPMSHPWMREGRQSVSWDEVLREPIVWREASSGIRRRVEQTLQAAGLEPSCSVEVTGIEALRDAVAAGLGVGFASVEALDKVRWPLASLRLDPPSGLFWTLYILHPEPALCSHALRAILCLLLGRESPGNASLHQDRQIPQTPLPDGQAIQAEDPENGP